MPINFPARHVDSVPSQHSIDDKYLITKAVFQELRWLITGEEYPKVFAKTHGSPTTFGERIIITIYEDRLDIRSECFIPTQFLDFGKNKQNVGEFLDTFHAVEGSDEWKQ